MSQIYVDEVIQSFVNDGNVFLKFGTLTGDVDASGQDLKVSPVTLIVPLSRFKELARNFNSAADAYCLDTPINQSEIKGGQDELSVRLGGALAIGQ